MRKQALISLPYKSYINPNYSQNGVFFFWFRSLPSTSLSASNTRFPCLTFLVEDLFPAQIIFTSTNLDMNKKDIQICANQSDQPLNKFNTTCKTIRSEVPQRVNCS